MTRHLEVQYLRPVPLGRPLTLTARHVTPPAAPTTVEAHITDAAGQILATAKAVFVTIIPQLSSKVLDEQSLNAISLAAL